MIDKYIGTIAKIPDRNARMMFVALLQELEQLKSTKGPPEEIKRMAYRSTNPIFKMSESMEKIQKYKENMRKTGE